MMGEGIRSVPTPSTKAADLPFFPLPFPAAGLRVFLTPAEEATAPLVGALAGALAGGGWGSSSALAILRSFFKCSWTARGVQVIVSVVSWRDVSDAILLMVELEWGTCLLGDGFEVEFNARDLENS